MQHDHPENHLISRARWLRAAVLDADDGVTSTANLVMGVASAASNSDNALSPTALLLPVVSAGSLIFLALQGMIGAKANGADVIEPMIRVTFWGPCP